jgi:hypothetical protein
MSLLDFDFAAHAKARGGRLTVIANLPFGISSQVSFLSAPSPSARLASRGRQEGWRRQRLSESRQRHSE